MCLEPNYKLLMFFRDLQCPNEENDFEHVVSAYVNMLVQTLPATDNRSQDIQTT